MNEEEIENDGLEIEAEDTELEAEELEAARRWQGGRKRRKRLRMPSSTRRKSIRNRSRGKGRNRFRTQKGKTVRVKITPKQQRERKRYDTDYNKRRRKKTPSWRRRKRNRRASEEMDAIQTVMAEMGLYEIRPPDTDELYIPSGVPYSPSGGNGYYKRDLANRDRKPSEKQDTSREPSDVGNSSRVVPNGQFVRSATRVAYRFLMGV